MTDASKTDVAASPTTPPCAEGAAVERRNAWLLWIAGTVFFLAMIVAFFPKTTVVTDEVCYLTASRHFITGRAFDKTSEAWFWKETGHGWRRTFFSASPGFSALLVPFVLVGWRSAFLLGSLAHVLAFGGMIFILRRRGLHIAWALLYLLHPTAVLYSRTIMADVLSSALLVLILVILHARRPSFFLIGLTVSVGVVIKLSNLPIMGTFLLLMLLRDFLGKHPDVGYGPSRVNRLALLAGVLPGVVALVALNTCFFGSPLGNGYVGRSEGWFSVTSFVHHLPFYLVGLTILYPGMLLAPLFLRGAYRWEIRAACFVSPLFFSAYFFLDHGNTWHETLIRGLRFQLCVSSCYILAYACMVERGASALKWKPLLTPVLAATALVLAAGAAAISVQHQRHSVRELEVHLSVARALPPRGTVIAMTQASKYLSAARYPLLRIQRFLDLRDIPDLDRAPKPLMLLLLDPKTIRTEDYRKGVTEEGTRARQILEGRYDLVLDENQPEGFHLFRLAPRAPAAPAGGA